MLAQILDLRCLELVSGGLSPSPEEDIFFFFKKPNVFSGHGYHNKHSGCTSTDCYHGY